MADYCHDFDNGGMCANFPDPCPYDCVGDFTSAVRSWGRRLKPGYEVQLGICEGHGALLFLVKGVDGVLRLEHVSTHVVDETLPTIDALTRTWKGAEDV